MSFFISLCSIQLRISFPRRSLFHFCHNRNSKFRSRLSPVEFKRAVSSIFLHEVVSEGFPPRNFYWVRRGGEDAVYFIGQSGRHITRSPATDCCNGQFSLCSTGRGLGPQSRALDLHLPTATPLISTSTFFLFFCRLLKKLFLAHRT